MPRSAGGAYTVPGGTDAVSGAAIGSAAYNALLRDIETELSDSLSRSGKGSLSADLDLGAYDITFNTGGAIVWGSSNVTLTHSAATLSLGGAFTTLDFNSDVQIVYGTNTLGLTGGSLGYTLDAPMFIAEAAAAVADRAGYHQIWAKNDTPTTLWATDDAGTDFQLATLTGTETLTNKTLSAPALTDPVVTGAITEGIYTITDGAAFEIDPSNGTIQTITLGANRTPAATNFANGESVTLKIADGTAYAITWTTVGVVWKDATAPTLATTGYTVVELWKENNVIRGVHVGDFAS